MYPIDVKAQFRFLTKYFFEKFFDLESIAPPQVDQNGLVIQILFVLAIPGIISSLFLDPKYGHLMWRPEVERELATLDDKYFFISLSMILIGLIAVIEWDALFPDRKDYLVLTPLPIETRTVFLTKAGALAIFLLAFTVTIDLGPTILFPLEVLAIKATVATCIRYIFSHAISVLLANVFIFFSAISIQGILFVVLPGKLVIMLSKYLRFILFLAMISGLFFIPGVSSIHSLVQNHSALATLYPPIWFVGVYEVLLGAEITIWGPIALRALVALSVTGTISVIVYAISYQRFLRRRVELGAGALTKHGRIRAIPNFVLDRFFLRNARDRALFHFIGQTIFRSSRHGLRTGVYLAIALSAAAVGLITIAFSDDWIIVPHLDTAFLSIPLVLSFFLLTGTKAEFSIPVDLDANWLFRVAPQQGVAPGLGGIRKFMFCGILLPAFLCTALLYRLIWDWSVIVPHIFYCLVLSLLLIEFLLYRFEKVPFTCSYIPPPSSRVFKWPLFYIGFGCFAYVGANIEGMLIRKPHQFLYFCIILWVLLFVWIYRDAVSGGRKVLRFEEETRNAPIYLDLQS